MEKRCFACMNLTDQDVCRQCGHNNAAPDNVREGLLPPGTVVGGRYFVGLSIDRNGEGVTYIAFDQERQTRVRVREFFPGVLAHREPDHKMISVNPGSEIQYKALMTDFVELSKQLIGITANNNLLKARDILSDHGTIYVIYEDVNGVTLTRYLKDNNGELGWEETENLFLPLLYTVKLLNSNGIIHRGISPDTIIVTENHELKLKGICTSAVRAINTEIKSELFPGYAAPEQYEKCSSHGEWTDVYSICAVLYKTLTGMTPEQADARRGSVIRLQAPVELNSAVPQNVSNAIMRGLACDRANRTLYIKDLIGGLYAAVPVVPSARRLTEEEEEEETRVSAHRKHRRFRMPVWLIVILVTLPLLLILFFLLYDSMLGDSSFGIGTTSSATSSITSSANSSQPSSQESAKESSKETSSGEPKIVMDYFIGRYYEDIIANATLGKLYTFDTKVEEFDDNVPVGQVTKQSIEKGTVVEQGTKVTLTVSKGKQYVTLPPLRDQNNNLISVDEYVQYLTEQGLTVKVEKIDEPSYPKGEIARLSQEPGTAVDREKSSDLTVYVSTGESYDILYGTTTIGGEDLD